MTNIVSAGNLADAFYPETRFGGFSRCDGSVHFYTRVAALVKPDFRVLDFGAGRGAHILEDDVDFRRDLRIFKGRCREVVGCDIDPVVMENPYLDHAVTLEQGQPLPFDDNSFDLIVSNYVFEHVEHPEHVANELLRVVKPNGYICALTPNRFGYIALFARLTSNRLHTRFLKKIQPKRLEEDVFPTCYKLNRPSAIRKYFGQRAATIAYPHSPEPAYHFENYWIFAIQKMLHKYMPDIFSVSLMVFIQKNT